MASLSHKLLVLKASKIDFYFIFNKRNVSMLGLILHITFLLQTEF